MSLTPTVLLLDADGNLFPSEEPAFDASAVVTNELLAAVGASTRFTAEALRLATTGMNFRTTAKALVLEHGASGPLSAAELEHWVQEERARVTAHLGAVLRPDPTVLEPLQRLASRFELAAVSSSASTRLAACFAATGLDELVAADRRFSAEDSLPEPLSKPDPAVYEHACRVLGVEASQALAVEDSVPGVQSAVAAGIPTAGNLQFVPEAERGGREQQLREAGAVVVVSAWSELEALLG